MNLIDWLKLESLMLLLNIPSIPMVNIKFLSLKIIINLAKDVV